ncbi:MAG: DEAD/DEAH box helicase [Parcubacteria group bacterium]|nr:DEAD/DEAH box helicase [Parcubacteria group bacterium]
MVIKGAKTLTQQAYALARTIQETDAVFYWVLNDPGVVAQAAALLRFFSRILARGWPVNLLDVNDPSFVSSLFSLQQRQPGVYVLTKETMGELPKALGLLAENIDELHVGERLTPQQLKGKLVKLGYGHELFSAKGGVVQIEHNGRSYRVSFDEEKIEAILDVANNKPLANLFLYPNELDLSKLPAENKPLPEGQLVQPDESLEFALVPLYQQDFAKLGQDIRIWQEKKFSILAAAVDPDVLKEELNKEAPDLLPLDIHEQPCPAEGFVDLQNKFVFLGHAEIFGRQQARTERKRQDQSAFVTSLEENDYVVHEDHGVGRFLGLVTSTIEGHERENLLIEYAKGDRLYVPVELAYKVDRYVGEAKPALQRLSGTSWIRLTRKASLDSQEFARDLLKLYARRSLVSVEPWQMFPEADQQMHEQFGFTETPDQEQAIKDVYKDLGKHQPMDRLVVGDVGFGKTEVAIRAAYQAFLNHKQAIVLCPTTLLAQQHYDTFTERLGSLGVRVEMLSRFTGKIGEQEASVADIIRQLEAGKVDVVIGTHRLLSKDVQFFDAGLIIIDEEQRFGVRHKERLKQLRTQAHILTLSATPIPRTLYFSMSGLRDISTIATPPQGRKPIATHIEPYHEETVQKAIEAELQRGGQVFYLHNRVQTIQTAKKRLQDMLGAKVRIGIVHGQMPEDEMARSAEAFDHGKIDVLVCTTIIENGLDIPNVNTLVVENATRFGLGQLYQIRGRIGRGETPAIAYFMYPTVGLTGVAARRLQILEEAKELGSGFQLAMRDLEMRGMGQMIGQRQHGHIQSVGLGMYGRLLRQAVEGLESGQVQAPSRGVTISLPLDYGVPQSLIPEAKQRTRFYRQVSQLQSREEVEALFSPLTKQINTLPAFDQQRIENLKRILELRSLAQDTPIRVIDYQESEGLDGQKRQTVEFEFRALTADHVERLIPIIPDFKVAGQRIIVKAEDLGDLYATIKKILAVLANLSL